MDRERKRRYLLAVYLVVALLAVVLFFVGDHYFTGESTLYDLVVNLASDLIGVVLLFFVVNQVFLVDEDRDPRERLESIVSTFERKFAVVGTEEQISQRIGFPERIGSADSFYILALDASRVLKDLHQEIVASVIRGTDVRILLLDLEGESANLLQGRIADYSGSLYNYVPMIERMSNSIRASPQPVLGTFEVRYTDWRPSCRIIAFDVNQENSSMMVNIYPPSFSEPQYRSRFSVYLTPDLDFGWYRYFLDEYEKLWSTAKHSPKSL